MRSLLLGIFILLSVPTVYSQITISLEDKNLIGYLNKEINTIRLLFGKPSMVERDSVSQLFCGMSRGRDEHLFYFKSGIVFTTWKRLGYQRAKFLRTWKPKKYYKNCSVNSIKMTKFSPVKINGYSLNELTTTTVENLLKSDDYYLDEDNYEAYFDINSKKLKLTFIFDEEGKTKEVIMDLFE